jgi:hypothetical protein
MDDTLTLLEENNVISLRTAFVLDDGDLVSLRLMPVSLDSSKDLSWVSLDRTWLYRHKRSDSEELELRLEFPCVEQDVRPMVFEKPPELRLLWSDSGHSVALYLQGEPWAFIEEETHKGYSKGILKPAVGNPWDQELFERTFEAGSD